MPPEFEWDPIKNLKNRVNHRAWLSDAPALWASPGRKLTRGRTKDGETRFYVIGLYENKVWQAVFTLRAGKVRFISFRPASRRERDAYHRRSI